MFNAAPHLTFQARSMTAPRLITLCATLRYVLSDIYHSALNNMYMRFRSSLIETTKKLQTKEMHPGPQPERARPEIPSREGRDRKGISQERNSQISGFWILECRSTESNEQPIEKQPVEQQPTGKRRRQ